MSEDTDEMYRGMLARRTELLGDDPLPDIDYLCEECEDVHWVRVEILERDRYEGGPNHYMRPCSRCLPERYRIMVTENHGDPKHLDMGGCSTCRRYVKPWLDK